MIKSIKSISKRTLALILSMLMLLSSGIVGTLAANVELAETGAETITLRYQANMPSNYYSASNSLALTQSTNNTNRYYGTISLSANTSYGFYIIWGSNYYKASATASSDVSVKLSNYGSTNYGNSADRVTFTTSSAGTYIFTFDTSNSKIVVSPQTDTVKLAYDVASGHDSWYNLNNYVEFTQSSGSIYTLDLDLNAEKYYMFVQLKSSAYWRGTSTLTTSNAVSVYSYGTDNYGGSADKVNFTPSSAGTYRFTWNHNDKTISVAKLTYNVKKAETGGTGTVKLGTTTLTTSNVSLDPGTYDLSITAPSGYNVSNVTVTGGTLTAGTTGSSTYSGQVNVNADTTINVTYVAATYTYTVTAGEGGTVSPASGSVNKGSSVNITATPKDGYSFDGWTVTNGTVGSATSATTTFTPSANGANATASFKINQYTITYYDDDNITKLGTVKVNYGTLIKDADAPAATKEATDQYEYAFAGWEFADYTPIGDTAVTSDVVVYATYTATTRAYTVEYSGANGTVSVAYADGTVVPSGSEVPYGTELTLTATPDKFYNFNAWVAHVGNSSEDLEDNTYTVTSDVTLEALFAAKTTHNVRINQGNAVGEITATSDFDLEDQGLESNGATHSFKVEDGASIDFVVKAPVGYYISKANDVKYTDYANTQVEFSVNNVTISPTNVTVIYTALPTYNVTVSANDDTMGTVTGANDAVIYGNQVHLTAAANEGYRFVDWTIEGTYSPAAMDLTLANISIIPQQDIVATANFVANAGTINVSATEGGTVTNEGGEVTYPETVTSTAEADTANGYLFTHWTVTSDGTEGTDYTVSKSDNVITVQILTDGTVVDVVANFANAQKIKVYTYSDSGFTNLKVTESNGTEQVVFDGSQSTITFGDETWYTPGELTLTAGYNEKITAQLSSNVVDSATGTVIYIKISDEWDNHKWDYEGPTLAITGSENSAASKKINATDTSGIGTPYKPTSDSWVGQGTNIGNNVYKWVITDSTQIANLKTYGFTLYSKKISEAKVWEACITHGTYSTSANYYVVSSNYTTYEDNTYAAACFNTTSNGNFPTQTEVIDIVDILYNGNEWLGLDEVWLYFAAGSTTVVATQRRTLNDYVTSALIKKTYNSGTNDAGYTSDSWSAFTTAYTNAVSVLGAGASDQDAIDTAYKNLETAYKALALTKNVTIIGTHGAEPKSKSDVSYGITKFPDITTTTKEGNIGDNNSSDYYHYTISYLTASIDRGTTITINTQVTEDYAEDYLVYGWVVNGTEWVEASQDIEDTSLYVGTYTCNANATFTPIYFRKSTIANWKTDENIVKVLANTNGASEKWGNYISAYTWTNEKTYYQFGHWTGQLMIPDPANPGMYYTFVEMKNPDGTDDIAGIAFTNYGGNTPFNTEKRYQTYDYYEFKELKSLGFDNIVFQLKTYEGNENYPSSSGITISSYQFEYFRDFSGNMIDITRTALTDEQKTAEPELYIVRTGPYGANAGAGYRSDEIEGSDYYVDTYVYDKNGKFLVACKSFELLNLETLKTNSGTDLAEYAGAPVMVDYASLTYSGGSSENRRFDGEWYGTVYGFTNVTISAEVAYLNTDGTVTYYNTNEVENIGNAYFNGEHTQEVSHGSEGHTISSTVLGGNDFVGWYRATVADDGTYTIDITADPLFTERSATIDASADAIYVAVFKEHPEGTFTVNNFYYTYADFSGQTVSPYAPPVFGGDSSYSIRNVQIKKVYDSYNDETVSNDLGKSDSYTQSMEAVSVGDELEITIYTKPTYSRDYVYAWYIQADDSYGVNFEEIGTTREFDKTDDAYAEQSFTFTYTVKEGVSSLTIYSDVVHVTPEVTLTYIYNNRYNVEQKYIVKHTLTNGELASYTPSQDTISDNAPDVGDLYKEVSWNIDNVSSDATNWTLRATENATYTVNAYVNGDHKTFEGVYNSAISIYASDIYPDLTNTKGGLWYSDVNSDGDYTAGTDKIISYGSYYGLVITGNADIYYVSDVNLAFEIILADAVYNAEKATDDAGNVTTNKVYVDYLISYLIPCFNNGFLDLDGDGEQDDNEYVIGDPNNAYAPVSLEAIEAAGYTVDYGMVLELINTFRADTSANEKNIETYYGTGTMSTDYVKSFLAGKTKASETGCDGETYYYKYSAKDLGSTATNKNRVLMTFGYNNTTSNRNRYYNAIAYLTISDGTNTYYFLSNQATLNIAEVDEVES